MEDWYPALTKPPGTPPDWLFAPVWTALYVMMAFAAWQVWLRAGMAEAPVALGLWFVQLALNLVWSALFFGLRAPGAALVEIGALWLAVAATTAASARHDRAAPILLLPYLGWLGYAAYLNAGIWWLNR